MFRRKLLKNHIKTSMLCFLTHPSCLLPLTHTTQHHLYINSKTLVAVVYKITNEGDVFNRVRHSGSFPIENDLRSYLRHFLLK